ncbi:calcitonin receptor-like isoform X2 [Crassostrea virginica]|uniref:Calcitonin gene-related peptide type 1 receptor-like isoform X2 n=1 Tax=Crassostrea virginica TaxID=6565 RepID=A0A8B8C0L5_CRAVI|nr:calcitonin gene-related peptide type 1 receptor-like isoform X2 [Crassostrea virginica]
MEKKNVLFENDIFKQIHAHSAQICYEGVISKPEPSDGKLYCPPKHDDFLGCWNYTEAGTRAYIPCPEIPGFHKERNVHFDCLENGTWFVSPVTGREFADYSRCRNYQNAVKEMEKDLIHIYVTIALFCLSFIMISISLVIFFKFRQLRCDRITIHKNLFISYLLTDLFYLVYLAVIHFSEDIVLHNPDWCQVLHVITQYAIVSNFAWMFCEGLYLHTVMMSAFTSGKSVIIACLIIGWGVPVPLTIIYGAVRASLNDNTIACWSSESSFLWIMYAPVVLSMAINVVFVVNIMRLLITKLRQIPEVAQTRKAVRATAILIPLLGLQFLIFIKRPEDKDSTLSAVYQYVLAIFVPLQGAFVSIMYCFCNGEVRKLKNSYQLSTISSFRMSRLLSKRAGSFTTKTKMEST